MTAVHIHDRRDRLTPDSKEKMIPRFSRGDFFGSLPPGHCVEFIESA